MRERVNGFERVFLGAAHGDVPDPKEDRWAIKFYSGFGTYQDPGAQMGTSRDSSGELGAFMSVSGRNESQTFREK